MCINTRLTPVKLRYSENVTLIDFGNVHTHLVFHLISSIISNLKTGGPKRDETPRSPNQRYLAMLP